MSKILALDLGDQHVGVAISDTAQLFAHPLTTTNKRDLENFLTKIIPKEMIKVVVVGYPRTLRGTESQQTIKIKHWQLELANKFLLVQWILWDERFTSQAAAKIRPSKTKADRLKSHAIAAALILENYLQFLRFQSET